MVSAPQGRNRDAVVPAHLFLPLLGAKSANFQEKYPENEAWPKAGLMAPGGQAPKGARLRLTGSDVGDVLGIAQEFFAGGQAAAFFTNVLEVFQLALAIMLFVGAMLEAAVGTFHSRSLGIAQVPRLFRHGPAGGTDISFLFHDFLLTNEWGFSIS